MRIGATLIGVGHPCYVIAEAGSNHNGSLPQAKRLIDVAADAGADAVKFQLFRASRMYPRSAGVSGYLGSAVPIYDIIASMEMSYEWLPELAGYCESRNIAFLATPFDEDSADQLVPWVQAFKVASYEMTHIPLVRHVAAKGKPLIISTGTADIEEVEQTVVECRNAGNREIALLQCTAAYPAPLDALNIRALTTLSARFGVPSGLSDHSRDPVVAPIVAVACGARRTRIAACSGSGQTINRSGQRASPRRRFHGRITRPGLPIILNLTTSPCTSWKRMKGFLSGKCGSRSIPPGRLKSVSAWRLNGVGGDSRRTRCLSRATHFATLQSRRLWRTSSQIIWRPCGRSRRRDFGTWDPSESVGRTPFVWSACSR